jgi:DNA-binding LytR/AlgR family response regulator
MSDRFGARDRAGGDRPPTASAASTSRAFANSIGFFANVGSMQFTQRQRLFEGKWRPFAVAILVGLLLGFLGPFGSYPAYPTATRYAFWLGLTAAGVAAVVAADAALPGRLRAGAIRIGAVALVSALPMTFVVAWTMSLVQPGRVFAPGQLPALFAAVAAVQLLIVFATTATAPAAGRAEAPGRAPDLPEPAAEAAPAAFPSALLSRLPPGIGTDIFALETEDHYLRVHAAGGSALILMRMADAVALLDPRLGAQVHRRWWVAQGAVAGVRTEGQRLYLCLNDETQVPVGRTFSASAKARFAHARRLGPPGQALTIRERSTEKNEVEGLRE